MLEQRPSLKGHDSAQHDADEARSRFQGGKSVIARLFHSWKRARAGYRWQAELVEVGAEAAVEAVECLGNGDEMSRKDLMLSWLMSRAERLQSMVMMLRDLCTGSESCMGARVSRKSVVRCTWNDMNEEHEM